MFENENQECHRKSQFICHNSLTPFQSFKICQKYQKVVSIIKLKLTELHSSLFYKQFFYKHWGSKSREFKQFLSICWGSSFSKKIELGGLKDDFINDFEWSCLFRANCARFSNIIYCFGNKAIFSPTWNSIWLQFYKINWSQGAPS